MIPERLTPETLLARYERQGGGPLDGPGMLYRKEPSGGYAHVSRDVDDLVCFATVLQRRVAALVHVTALSTHEEGCISTYGHAGDGLDYLCDDLFNEQCECGVAEGLRNLLDADTIEAVRRERAALAASPTGEENG